VPTIGVTYGVSQESEIREAQPDHVIHSFAEMRRFMAASPGRLVEARRNGPACSGLVPLP